MNDKPKTKAQGKIIVERHNGDWFVMLPDGSVEVVGSKEAAEKVAKRWFKSDADDDSVNVGLIEWR